MAVDPKNEGLERLIGGNRQRLRYEVAEKEEEEGKGKRTGEKCSHGFAEQRVRVRVCGYQQESIGYKKQRNKD